jgi:hypothetical protein
MDEMIMMMEGKRGKIGADENIWWEWEMGRWGLFFELGQDTTIRYNENCASMLGHRLRVVK